MQKNRKDKTEDFSLWQPASDMFSALLLILMLVILLLGLYLVNIPNSDEVDPYYGDDVGGFASPVPTAFIRHDAGGGGGGGEEATPTPEPTPTPTPTPTTTPTPIPIPGAGGGDGPGYEPDEGIKSAVCVMLVDAETDKTVKEEGVEFELYEEDGTLQLLNTYYPERITFQSYKTTESGLFYFPEKLFQGTYTVHEITEPDGYDMAENQTFVLNELFDWPEPYVVRVPIYPSRNIVRVQMVDAETNLPVSGGSFEVVADDNIITSDGTLRYRAGQVVGEFTCDENGYGESEPYYLGEYRLRQSQIPQYYASYQEEIPVTIEKKTSVEPPLNTLANERTRINGKLTDELFESRGIEGAVYRVTTDSTKTPPFEVTTDKNGSFVLEELEKGVTYTIRQTETVQDYILNAEAEKVSVGLDGRIYQEPEMEVSFRNRMLRVTLGITDEFSRAQIPNVSLALYDSDDQLIKTWITTGAPITLTNLKEGNYYLIKDADTESRYEITVRNQAETQAINIHATNMMLYLVVAAAALFVLILLILVLVIIKRKRKRKAAGHVRDRK